MTKVHCDICGEEIIVKTLATDNYWVEIQPYAVVEGMKEQVRVNHKDVCSNYAQSISRYLDDLKMARGNIWSS